MPSCWPPPRALLPYKSTPSQCTQSYSPLPLRVSPGACTFEVPHQSSDILTRRSQRHRFRHRDATCYFVDSHSILQRSAVRILDLCQSDQAHRIPDADHHAAVALHYLTALAATMPLDALLANKAMLPRVVTTAIARATPDKTRALAWTTALALSRRLVESPHNFQARIASARLLPLLERTHRLLECASTQPRRVFAGTCHAHWLRKELLSALQLLCNLGSGDVYFSSRLHQLHMPAALLAFANADIVGTLADDGDAAALAARMQGAARRLQRHLLDDA